jgi:heat shock protein HslJ
MISKVLVLCAIFYGITTGGSDLTGRIWSVGELNNSSEDLIGYQIMFTSKDSARCLMECNTAFFLYAVDGQSIAFTYKSETIRFCSVTREGELVSALKKVNRTIAAGKTIYLLDDTDTLLSLVDAPKPPLSGTSWVLEELEHSSDNISGYWLAFSNDTLAKTHMHCNSCSYRYSINGDTITFAGGSCTVVACMPTNREGSFEKAMSKVTRWNRSGNRLFLMDSTDTLIRCIDSVVFALLRQPWILHSFKRDSSLIKIATPEKYALTFMVDGSVRVIIDCNTCDGLYSAANGISQLYMMQFACTNVLCGPDSQDIALTYMSLLNRVTGCSIRSDTLICYSTNGIALWFTRPTSSIGPLRSPRSVKARCPGIRIIRKKHALSIELENGALVDVRLINARGVCVKSSDRITGNQAVVHTVGLPAGVYLLRAVSGTGAWSMIQMRVL